MKQFDYTIQEAVGIHARPAGLLVKEVKKVIRALLPSSRAINPATR